VKAVTYLSECDKEYISELNQCDSLAKLVAHTVKWKPIANDAYEIACYMNYTDWYEFEKGYALEKKNRVHGAGLEWQEKYAAIVLPEILLRVSVIAVQFQVPWGLAFHRLIDAKMLKKSRGVYVWTGDKNQTSQPG